MKRPMMIVILVLLMLSACASITANRTKGFGVDGVQWCKQGVTESDFDRDSIDCRYKGLAEISGSAGSSQMRDYRIKCMTEKGWGECP